MRLLPNIAFGTERYPEKIARRLRAVNLTAWSGAAVAAAFAIQLSLNDWTRLKWLAGANALGAVIWACIPLLHRFGALAAALFFAVSVYASNFLITAMLGLNSGVQLYFIPAAALVVLFFGIERMVLSIAFVVLAAALMIAAYFLLPPDTGLLDRPLLVTNLVVSIVATLAILFAIVAYAVRQIARAEAEAEFEFQRSEALLANILPPAIAARLKTGKERVIADSYDEASILFADMAGFTARSAATPPAEMVMFLNRIFTSFDRLVERYGLEKIKTSGDAYMVVSGVPEPRTDHVEALAALALEMQQTAGSIRDGGGEGVRIRIGLALGAVVGGVVGTRKFFYDVWGDAVNVASRMESTGEPGRIQVTREVYERLKDRFEFEPRGTIDVRGKGKMETWFLVGRRAGDS